MRGGLSQVVCEHDFEKVSGADREYRCVRCGLVMHGFTGEELVEALRDGVQWHDRLIVTKASEGKAE